MANGSDHRERGLAAQADREKRQREALLTVRRKVSWKAVREIERRLKVAPETLEPKDLVAIAKLEQGDRPKEVTLQGNPQRPLIIGLEPARESLARMGELAPPAPLPALPEASQDATAGAMDLTDDRGQLRPMRLSFTGPAVPVDRGEAP